MNTAVINIKVEPRVKKEAQKVAREMGLSLSALINGLLVEVVKTKMIIFSASDNPIASAELSYILKEARKYDKRHSKNDSSTS